jgi:histidinol-phosphatase (PHP family)
VGSVHHVNDIPFDYNPDRYREAVERCGGVDALYSVYFDLQKEMIQTLKPRVVGHMDIIRIFDPEYRNRLGKPEIWKRILRNLELIKELDLILDFNLRPLSRGEEEPYLSESILKQACEMGIAIVPGDDAHKVADIGANMDKAIDLLLKAGGNIRWRPPVDCKRSQGTASALFPGT